jgi:hypothetical protein
MTLAASMTRRSAPSYSLTPKARGCRANSPSRHRSSSGLRPARTYSSAASCAARRRPDAPSAERGAGFPRRGLHGPPCHMPAIVRRRRGCRRARGQVTAAGAGARGVTEVDRWAVSHRPARPRHAQPVPHRVLGAIRGCLNLNAEQPYKQNRSEPVLFEQLLARSYAAERPRPVPSVLR